MLSSVFNSNDNLDIQTKRFIKRLDGSIAKCFNKVRVNNKGMKMNNSMKVLKELINKKEANREDLSEHKLWLIKRRLCPKYREPPSAMLDKHGNLLTDNRSVLNRAVEAHIDRLKPTKIPIKKGINLEMPWVIQMRSS